MGVFFKYMVILELGGTGSFNDLSQRINTLWNQDFAVLDKFNKLENLFCSAHRGLSGSWIRAGFF